MVSEILYTQNNVCRVSFCIFIDSSLDTLNLKLKVSVLPVLVIKIHNNTCFIKMFVKNEEPFGFK